MTMTDTARVRLPVIFCPDCTAQLVNFLHVVRGTDTVVCVFCAKQRPAGTVAPISADGQGFVTGGGDVLDPVDAVALLVRLGGSIEEPER